MLTICSYFLFVTSQIDFIENLIEIMFSTPQSKAFFSQEIVKGKLISDELQLVNSVHERVW